MKQNESTAPQAVCERLAKHDQLGYLQAERALEKCGFMLREYGGLKQAYAIFTHKPSGIVVNVEYNWRHMKAESYVADRVTAFYWYADRETVAQYE